MKHHRAANYVANLIDVKSRIEPIESETKFRVRTDVRIGKAETDSPIGTLSTKRAFLELLPDGVEVVPGRRYGEPVKVPIVEETERTRSASAKASSSAGAAASASQSAAPELSAALKVGAEFAIEDRNETKTKSQIERSYVKARGGDQWEIYEGGKELQDTYIMSEDTLCHLEKFEGTNRSSVTIQGVVRKRDLDFKAESQITSALHRVPGNKEKAILAFLTAKMAGKEGAKEPKIVLSIQEFSDE